MPSGSSSRRWLQPGRMPSCGCWRCSSSGPRSAKCWRSSMWMPCYRWAPGPALVHVFRTNLHHILHSWLHTLGRQRKSVVLPLVLFQLAVLTSMLQFGGILTVAAVSSTACHRPPWNRSTYLTLGHWCAAAAPDHPPRAGGSPAAAPAGAGRVGGAPHSSQAEGGGGRCAGAAVMVAHT